MYESVINSVPEEIQTVIPQVTGIPVVFVSALEGTGRLSVMRQVVDTYEKWCLRLPTARLNRWFARFCPKILLFLCLKAPCKKIFRLNLYNCVGYEQTFLERSVSPTQDKVLHSGEGPTATFVAFVSGKVQLSDTDLRFLTKSLKEDFDLGGIPVRIMQPKRARRSEGKKALPARMHELQEERLNEWCLIKKSRCFRKHGFCVKT
ncbi:hypothetical protein DH2020_003148 [Rehmannia glutinosa]|uniref:Uncharacterized protein n=1 Tax=Rehmannia glutinosa TaxID=99300 RepID=A0ABR0XKT0_REHGL